MDVERHAGEDWRNWTFGDFMKHTEEALRQVDFPPNASFSPLALHYYKEGILLDLRYRTQVYATTWLSEHANLAELRNWAVTETLRFAAYRKEQRQLIKSKRSKASPDPRG